MTKDIGSKLTSTALLGIIRTIHRNMQEVFLGL